jgi:hypothetical protein
MTLLLYLPKKQRRPDTRALSGILSLTRISVHRSVSVRVEGRLRRRRRLMTPQVATRIECSTSSGTAFGGRQGQDDWMRRCSRKSNVLVADHNQEDFRVMLAVLGLGMRRCEPWPPIRMKRLTRVGCNQEDVECDTCLSQVVQIIKL